MELLEQFKEHQASELDKRNQIIVRLLEEQSISSAEAVELMKVCIINISANELQVSAGGKILGGSDLSRRT